MNSYDLIAPSITLTITELYFFACLSCEFNPFLARYNKLENTGDLHSCFTFTQSIRIKNVCSDPLENDRQIGKLVNHFIGRDYLIKVTTETTFKAPKVDRDKRVTYSSKTPNQRLPMVFDFSYKLTKVSRPLSKTLSTYGLNPAYGLYLVILPLVPDKTRSLRSLLASSRLSLPLLTMATAHPINHAVRYASTPLLMLSLFLGYHY